MDGTLLVLILIHFYIFILKKKLWRAKDSLEIRKKSMCFGVLKFYFFATVLGTNLFHQKEENFFVSFLYFLIFPVAHILVLNTGLNFCIPIGYLCFLFPVHVQCVKK